jgi:hypothetical protein
VAIVVKVSSPSTHNSEGIGVAHKSQTAVLLSSSGSGGGGGGAAPTGAEAQSWSDG